MDLRVMFLCIVAVCGRAAERGGRREAEIGTQSDSGWSNTSSDDFALDHSTDFNALARLRSGGRQNARGTPASSSERGGSGVDAREMQQHPKSRLRTSPSGQAAKTAPLETYEDDKRSDVASKSGTRKKPSYPSEAHNRRSDPSAVEYYRDLYSKREDVEMILPNEKAIILPMVNGKPRPYDGYRTASEAKPHRWRQSRDGETAYGKPKEGEDSPYRFERSAAEYHGGIYPHFDYSDPENAARIAKAPKKTHKKRKNFENLRDAYAHSKGNRKTDEATSGEKEAEVEEAEEEERFPAYKYHYDSSVVVPELKIHYYPYERLAEERYGDSNEEGTDESRDGKPTAYDEYTASYEQYKRTLPTDLEKIFGIPELGDYSVEASENLENSTNCEKLRKKAPESAAQEDKAETEVCYVCSDPRTGGSYTRCSYETEPKTKKFYYEGTSTFREDNSPEPFKYRYKRSSRSHGFDLDRFVFGRDGDVKRSVGNNAESRYLERPRSNTKKRHKNWKSEREGRYPSHNYHRGSPSRTQRSKEEEELLDSYGRPQYAREGPSEYYDTSDYGIEDDEMSSSGEETQGKPKANKCNAHHPDGRHGQSARESHHEEEPDRDEFEEDYNPEQGYAADYRFGPEHFVDDEELEEKEEEAESENRPNPSRKRLKQGETGRSASTESDGREGRNVKVFKNGDVCRKKKVDGMICMVCKNEKTADTYEQCQYSSKPKDKYYAYGSQKSYRTSDPDTESGKVGNEDQQPEKSDVFERKIMITKQRKIFRDGSGVSDTVFLPHGDLQGASSDNLESQLNEPHYDADNGQESESITRMEPRDGIEGLEEYLYSNGEDSDRASDEGGEYNSYDDYFRDIFPEFSNIKYTDSYSEEAQEESEEDEDEAERSESESRDHFDPFSKIRKFKKDSPDFLNEHSEEASTEEPLHTQGKRSREHPHFFENEREDYHKKDIEKALGEFRNRDWSKCKKIAKDKLICYKCADGNGVSNEECMYVEASEPIGPEVKKANGSQKAGTRRDMAKARARMRRPKNAMEETKTAERKVATRRRPIGDFEGAEAVQEEDVMTPVPSITLEEAVDESKEEPRTRRKQKQRAKTSKGATDAAEPEILGRQKDARRKRHEKGGKLISQWKTFGERKPN